MLVRVRSIWDPKGNRVKANEQEVTKSGGTKKQFNSIGRGHGQV